MTNENTNTDEPSKGELHDRVEQLESTVEKLMPSRRDALKLGAAGIAGAAGVAGASQSADASTGSAGTIGSSGSRPDAFLDEANVNQLTGVSTGGDRQGCRVFLSSSQGISSGVAAKIGFDSEKYDSGGNFDTSTHNWTCPSDGLYMANLQLFFQAGRNSEQRRAIIGTGGNAFPSGEGADNAQVTDSGVRLSVTTINKYSSGDTIAAYAQNSQSNDEIREGNNISSTFLEVAFLGGL